MKARCMDMNVRQEKLLDFMAEGAGQLRIPVFQRP